MKKIYVLLVALVTMSVGPLVSTAKAGLIYTLEDYRVGDTFLPDGFTPTQIAGTHNNVWVSGKDANGDFGIYAGIVDPNTNTLSWGTFLRAPSLQEYLPGADPAPTPLVGVNDLVIDAGTGKPLLIGASSSPTSTTSTNSTEATVWQLDASGTALIPAGYGYPGPLVHDSAFGAGDGRGNFIGDSGAGSPVIYQGNIFSFLPTDNNGGFTGEGIVSDIDGDTAVGDLAFSPSIWTKNASGTWTISQASLPSGATEGNILEIGPSRMGGFVYDPNLDYSYAAAWNRDGSLAYTLNLEGYYISEMVNDHGIGVDLISSNAGGPDYIFYDGLLKPRLVYGDLLPALSPGINGHIVDIADGGSIWFLNAFAEGGVTHYGVASVNSSAGTTAVPEPSSLFLFCSGALGLLRLRRR